MRDAVARGGPLEDLNNEADLYDDIGDSGDLAALIAEHATQQIGPLWQAEIRNAAATVARRYPPAVYARGPVWDDDAVDDLVQDVVERMLTKGQARYICDAANDFGHARALIYRQVKLTLADRRQRTAVDNLYARAVHRLDEPPFEQLRTKPRAWQLTGSPGDTDPHRSRLIAALAALPRVPGTGQERASAIWTAATLTDALRLVCHSLGEVEERDLRKILDDALTVFATSELVTDEAGTGERSGDLDPDDQIMANALTQKLYTALTQPEITVLAGKWMGDSDGSIAHRLGVSRPTAAKHKESAFMKIHEELAAQSDAVIDRVFDRLQTLLIVAEEGVEP